MSTKTLFILLSLAIYVIACITNNKPITPPKPSGYKTPPPKVYTLQTPTLDIKATSDSTFIGVWFNPRQKGSRLDVLLYYSKNYKFYEQNIYLFDYDSAKVWLNRELKKIKLNTNFYLESRGGLMIGIASDSNMIHLALDTTHITGYDTHIASIQQIIAARNAYIANCSKNDSTTIGRWDDSYEEPLLYRLYKESNKLFLWEYSNGGKGIISELNAIQYKDSTVLKVIRTNEKLFNKHHRIFHYTLIKKDSSLHCIFENRNVKNIFNKFYPNRLFPYNFCDIDSFYYTPNQY